MRNFLGAFLLFCIACMLNREIIQGMANMASHPARPGSTRKSAKKIMGEHGKNGKALIYAYYGSWANFNNPLSVNGPKADVLYMSFANFKTTYNGDLRTIATEVPMTIVTGLQYGTIEKFFTEMKTIREKNPNIIILLSLGGESHQPDSHADALGRIENVVRIVDDLGFDGVDIDYEPGRSFDRFSEKPEVDFFVEYVNILRERMCEDKIISISVSSNGALPCTKKDDKSLCLEPNSPYGKEYMSGKLGPVEQDIVLGAGYGSAGTAISIMNTLKNTIDIVFVQTYNLTEASNPLSMLDLYKSFTYFADKYGFAIAMGFSTVNGNTRYAPNDKNLVSKLSSLIKESNKKSKRPDGMGMWSLSSTEAFWKDDAYLPLWLESLKN